MAGLVLGWVGKLELVSLAFREWGDFGGLLTGRFGPRNSQHVGEFAFANYRVEIEAREKCNGSGLRESFRRQENPISQVGNENRATRNCREKLGSLGGALHGGGDIG